MEQIDSIEVSCPGCAKRFKAPGRLAGRQVRCPACATTISVPAGEPAYTAEPEQYESAPQEDYAAPSEPYGMSADPNPYAAPAYPQPPAPPGYPENYAAQTHAQPPAYPQYPSQSQYPSQPPAYGGAGYYGGRAAKKPGWGGIVIKVGGGVLGLIIVLIIAGAIFGGSGREKALLGKWKMESQHEGIPVKMVLEFKEDKTCRWTAEALGIKAADTTGKWELTRSGRQITLYDFKGLGTDMLPAKGKNIPWRFDHVKSDELVFGTASGTETWKRVPN